MITGSSSSAASALAMPIALASVGFGVGMAAIEGGEELVKAIVAAHEAFLKHVDQEHINTLNALFKANCSSISTPPFELDKTTGQYHPIYISDDELNKFSTGGTPGNGDTLDYFFLCLQSHGQKMRYLYFLRIDEHADNRHDAFSKALLHHMHIIHNYCTQFEGYDRDLKVIEEMRAYTAALSYWKNPNNSNTQTHSQLTDALTDLDDAIVWLKMHNHQRRLEEEIGKFKRDSIAGVEALKTFLLNFIVEEKHRNAKGLAKVIPAVTFRELSEGVCRRKHIKRRVGQLVLQNESSLSLPECMLTEGIEALAKFHLSALDRTQLLTLSDVPDLDKLLVLPSIFAHEESNLFHKKTKAEKEQQMKREASEKIYKKLAKVFKKSKSVITQKRTPGLKAADEASSEIIKEPAEIKKRVQILIDLCRQWLLRDEVTHLLIRIQELTESLGTIYIEENQDASSKNIFLVLNDIRQRIDENIRQCEADIEKVKAELQGINLPDSPVLERYHQFLTDTREKYLKHFDNIKALRVEGLANEKIMKDSVKKAKERVESAAETMAAANKISLPVSLASVSVIPLSSSRTVVSRDNNNNNNNSSSHDNNQQKSKRNLFKRNKKDKKNKNEDKNVSVSVDNSAREENNNTPNPRGSSLPSTGALPPQLIVVPANNSQTAATDEKGKEKVRNEIVQTQRLSTTAVLPNNSQNNAPNDQEKSHGENQAIPEGQPQLVQVIEGENDRNPNDIFKDLLKMINTNKKKIASLIGFSSEFIPNASQAKAWSDLNKALDGLQKKAKALTDEEAKIKDKYRKQKIKSVLTLYELWMNGMNELLVKNNFREEIETSEPFMLATNQSQFIKDLDLHNNSLKREINNAFSFRLFSTTSRSALEGVRGAWSEVIHSYEPAPVLNKKAVLR